MNRKSPTCKSKKTGRPLTEYETKADAKSNARHIGKAYGNTELAPYKCRLCGLWHLSPIDRHTPSRTCSLCRGANGKLKESYASEKDALRRADILMKENGVNLKVYPCEHGQGWHLTKTGQFR